MTFKKGDRVMISDSALRVLRRRHYGRKYGGVTRVYDKDEGWAKVMREYVEVKWDGNKHARPFEIQYLMPEDRTRPMPELRRICEATEAIQLGDLK